ncbi:MAG: AmmeMemoRadiSam system protein B [Candidatus Magasanikbacteria bacterium CG10_big_fil_rev_8_21_14_0_10_47_10]|uniref:AmmeMemoRadiSam system protein B n=1 Tax=Candidatus Magasanikbacteria bacterium CG10_big_fil_rev_8_21_14_0_10_47_10 TaxID=1974652 RepID=A0A2H0TPE9_9BACT|nr:MAG: AmmeMemoRadiSam system protein B [Candidatus Magasanikbacteria bacterium CG10_big_fil_rev_8_21_14_0_10_47_10]
MSPHEGRYDDAFVVNAHTSFSTSFEEFGDSVTSLTVPGTPDLAAKISHIGNQGKFPIRLISEAKLSYGTGVAVHYLTTHLPNVHILPIGFSNASPEDHMQFGRLLKDVIMESGKNIAVISSGDLAHCLTKDAPIEYNERGAMFDNHLIDLLQKKDVAAIAQMDPDIVSQAHECGYRTLLILLGIMENMDFTFQKYSYEYPYGVGYLVGNFVI